MYLLSGRRALKKQVCADGMSYASPETTTASNKLMEIVKADGGTDGVETGKEDDELVVADH